MNAGRLIILRVASLGRDAQNERDGARTNAHICLSKRTKTSKATTFTQE